ncbi:hypothetical protein SLH46_05820 [Draconibacterium sp. IB214405]|uniref:hypothetical protein n=1 Tax=Draconibacterium sp. IB214405 TaxID=3097352 RepID=UPI002A185023|nr:hypothetical protein [Draconibacterium sp. IB214405]MDX8338690.1 hypothetical protein [Draconibacterium sp. IB214405]
MNQLQEYIDRVFSFEKNQDPTNYEERVGPPEALPAVIGRISMNFQSLEDELSIRIIQLLNIDKEIGEIITAELSFKNKVNLFASLYYKLKARFEFTIMVRNYEDEYFKELIKALNRCEEFRNQILHSSIIKDWSTKQIFRTKTTAKAKKGLNKINQQVDIPYLFNVADYIIGMLMELENFFIDFKIKTQPNNL